MTRRANFTTRTKLAAWQRAGGPDDPNCECGKLERAFCFRMPITKSDPAEYHHIEEAESGDTSERRAYLKSLENCLCVRRSCHKQITRTETMPKIVKSRSQRAGEANAKTRQSSFETNRDGPYKQKLDGKIERR